LTIYPLSGDGTYSPKEFDLELGSYWKLPHKSAGNLKNKR